MNRKGFEMENDDAATFLSHNWFAGSREPFPSDHVNTSMVQRAMYESTFDTNEPSCGFT